MNTRMRRQGNPGTATGAGRVPPVPADDFDGGADAYSIPAFARRHGFSQSFYFKLKAQGLGPEEMRVGRRVLISTAAAKQWRKQRTTASK